EAVQHHAVVARAVGIHQAEAAGAARRTRSAAAVDVGLVAVLHHVRAARRLAGTALTDLARAVHRVRAHLTVGARRTDHPAAVDVRLVLVLNAVDAARRRRADAAHAVGGIAVAIAGAALSHAAARTDGRAPAVQVGLALVLDAVVAGRDRDLRRLCLTGAADRHDAGSG